MYDFVVLDDSCGELSADNLTKMAAKKQSKVSSTGLTGDLLMASLADDGDSENETEYDYESSNSQLSVIFNIIGTPSSEDLEHLDPSTASILRKIQGKSGKVRNLQVLAISTYRRFNTFSSSLLNQCTLRQTIWP